MPDLPITIDDLYVLEREMYATSGRLSEYLATSRYARDRDMEQSLRQQLLRIARA